MQRRHEKYKRRGRMYLFAAIVRRKNGARANKQNSCVVVKANTTRNSVGVNPQVEATIKSFETNRGDANLSCLSTSLLSRVLLVEDSASTEWLL